MNKILAKFNEFASETTLRFDPKFLGNYKSFSQKDGFVQLQDLFTVVENNKCDLEGKTELRYCEITNIDNFGDCEPTTVDISAEVEDPEIRRLVKKVLKGDCIGVLGGDILISSVRPYLKKFVFINKENETYNFTKAFIHLRSKVKVDPELLYGFIRSSFIANQLNNVSRMGKGYPVLKKQDLRYVYFPEIVFNKKLNIILEEIKQKREKAQSIQKKIKNVQDIMNETLAGFFSFNLKGYREALNEKFFEVALTGLGNNRDLRFSPKFHNPKYDFIDGFLKSQKTVRLRGLLDIPSNLGISPDYDDNGEGYYLSMNSIKSGEIDFENSRKVKDEFYKNNKERFGLKKFDILMARSGKGTIGKVAILLEDVPNIFADFTIRIKPNQRLVNPFYLFYYMQSIFFQENVERYHKGLGNMINIFPSQIEQFKVVIPKTGQNGIVTKIQTELKKNENHKRELQELRTEIDSIIDDVLD